MNREKRSLRNKALGLVLSAFPQNVKQKLAICLGAPPLDKAIAYVNHRGFVLFDVDELIRSPSDGTVRQIDALFCRADSPLRNQRRWRTGI